MAVHQDRVVRFSWNFEKQKRRAVLEASHVKCRAFRLMRFDPALRELERAVHVPMRLPVAVEHR